jgi:hypothetical protein
MGSRELRLGLSGRTPVFDDGPPFCLACGRRPVGTRLVAFKDVEYANRATEGVNTLLGWVHPALAWANRERLVSFKIDAPVCLRHQLAGRWIDLGVAAFAAAALVTLVVLTLRGILPRRPGELGGFLKAGLVILPIAGAWAAVRFRSKRGVLPCTGRRESRERIVLEYEGEAPSRR